MIIKNKGLSPIIATVVLLTLTITIAGIVYKYGNEVILRLSPPADCSQVSFEAGIFKEIDSSKTLELTNTGNVKIDSFILQLNSKGNSDNFDLLISLEKGESSKQSIDLEIPEYSTARIIPLTKNAKDETSQCSEEYGKLISIVNIEK